MQNTHGQVTAAASSGLHQSAIGLGAEVIALLQPMGSRIEVTYFWSRLQRQGTERRLLDPQSLISEVVSGIAAAQPVSSGTPLAALLRDSVSDNAQSFLLFPLPADASIRTGVIGFKERQPPVDDVPEAIRENLKLLGWADWSVREIARLRGELRVVNERLAGRKLVERAKSALQTERKISEEEAYAYLRSLSRKRRVTLAEASADILTGRTGVARRLSHPAPLNGQQPGSVR